MSESGSAGARPSGEKVPTAAGLPLPPPWWEDARGPAGRRSWSVRHRAMTWLVVLLVLAAVGVAGYLVW